MFKVCVFLGALALCSALTYEEWKVQHKKSFTGVEDIVRKQVFLDNDQYINWFNSQEMSYTLDHNEFSHLSHVEFKRMFLSPMTPKRDGDKFTLASMALPDSVDWRTKGYVTAVKNQGQCGSCWSFSTTGSLEGQHFAKTGKLVSLSEQNLVDCSGAEGNEGCNGGLMDDAFKYIIKNGGIDTEASYPYTARDGTCHFSASNVGATVSSYVDVTKDSEADLQTAVANVGPISIAIDAADMSFQFYRKGVYDPLICSSTKLDHGVLAVGYGNESGKDYWLVKNSWGESWGMQGYINMVRNENNKCGVASAASYPVV